ncbi:MAG TPA: hypothetical protein H9874_06575 [Candidatus Bilophila faecipullorum]|uniref:Uncharacterized protein n=1 Tax=Candidatus Bilophila faecipullorum TaxID=2838482 RepID=A0A9D1U8U4_9BACT|nr:hypothetical protein [uncultured Bilophila sp.]HIW78792.1 hypothetical protein [Candidatus Bilophila faecipullorum]
MKTYRYTGTHTTGVTLEVGGEPFEAMLFPGRVVELPDGDPWVKRMIKRGYLIPVETAGEPMKAARKAKAPSVSASAPETKEAS